MTKMHQIIAIEQGVAGDATRAVDQAKANLRDDPRMSGLTRTYAPRAEDGDTFPDESTRVQIRADEVLKNVAARLKRLYDVTYSREEGNTRAKADIKVDGQVIVRDVPVGFLMFLTRQLGELRDFISKLPLLDPAETWHWDEVSACYRTDPSKRARMVKLPRNHVLYPATTEHPAQVQVFSEDKPVGDWTAVRFSGAMQAGDVNAMLGRVDKLLEAVKFAREEANSTEAVNEHPGDILLGYVLGL